MSKAVRVKMSVAQKRIGNRPPRFDELPPEKQAEVREKLSKRAKERHQSEAAREIYKKISDALKGKKIPLETRKKISATLGNGKTEISRRIRVNSKYKEWRARVFRRDGFTCQICKQVGRDLEAHHIKPMSDILQEKEIETLEDAIKCRELWRTDNGVTLCKECHRLVHRKMRS